jgi:hypothetical protein
MLPGAQTKYQKVGFRSLNGNQSARLIKTNAYEFSSPTTNVMSDGVF